MGAQIRIRGLEALRIFRELFPDKGRSWFMRCFRRVRYVRKLSENERAEYWVVEGLPQLGDRRRSYIVRYDKRANIYYCSCYDPLRRFSSWRRRRTCTHVGAVILYKIMGNLAERQGGRK